MYKIILYTNDKDFPCFMTLSHKEFNNNLPKIHRTQYLPELSYIQFKNSLDIFSSTDK